MIKRLLNRKSNSIASAAVIVASFSIVSRVIGFFRDRILAGQFGAGDSLDAYFAAFKIPDLLFQLIVVGALSASFIPLFTKYYGHKNNKKAWILTNDLLNIIALVFGILVIVFTFIAPQVSPLIAPGFTAEKQQLVAQLARIMFGAQFFLAISMVYGSVLQGAKRFIIYSLAPIFYNLGIIFGAVFLSKEFGVNGVAYGVVIGAIMHLALQWIGVKTLGYKYKMSLHFKSPDMIYTLKHMLPRLLGLAVNQVNFLAMTIIASTLAVGSVTILTFAYNLNFFPLGVIAVSYAVAAFPTFCELANRKKYNDFVVTFSSTVRQILFFIIPATFIFILLRAQIVRVVLGAGQFDWHATVATADLLGFFMISLFAQAIIFVLVRAYFAFNDTFTPFVVGLGASVINVIGAVLFTKNFGVVGLGLSFSLASIVQMLMLWFAFRGRIGSLDEKNIFRSLIILVFAGVLGALGTQIVKSIVVQLISLDTFMGVFLQGFIAGLSGLIIYCLVAYLLKSVEMREFISGMKKKLFKKNSAKESIVTQI